MSEGSVRDALSLLDRALLSLDIDNELDLTKAQEIFGYFDKSQLVNLFELILKGNQTEVINIYRKIYDQGVEPKVFINDFLELLYYFKNINSLTLESTNFNLNDDEFKKIKDLSKQIDHEVLILFWQFTVSSLKELDIVANQHLSIEMFLIRLMHLSSVRLKEEIEISPESENDFKNLEIDDSSSAVSQIKNIIQEEKSSPEIQKEVKSENILKINSIEDLISICSKKKEIKLKYELEKNVNLVKFEKNRIEISFNESLDKNFVKDLSLRLYEWTGQRWIITLSKIKGEISIKEKKQNIKIESINNAKNSKVYKLVLEKFPDASLVDITVNKDEKK